MHKRHIFHDPAWRVGNLVSQDEFSAIQARSVQNGIRPAGIWFESHLLALLNMMRLVPSAIRTGRKVRKLVDIKPGFQHSFHIGVKKTRQPPVVCIQETDVSSLCIGDSKISGSGNAFVFPMEHANSCRRSRVRGDLITDAAALIRAAVVHENQFKVPCERLLQNRVCSTANKSFRIVDRDDDRYKDLIHAL